MFFTQHAVERFRRRWAPGLSHAAALRELITLSQTARPLRERTFDGEEQWEASDGSGLVFVVRRDQGRKRHGFVCVTVLPQREQPEDVEPEAG